MRDSGPGVPPDLREQIFTDGVTTKSSVTGARRGLGLALVRQIVEGMGGMVSVGQDGGAVFTAVLPGCLDAAGPSRTRRRPTGALRRPAPGAAAPGRVMIRTLVVDDDFRVAAIHAAYVNKVDGFEVIAEAHTAAEAVDAVDRLRPDLMLLDLYLPDEHGLKLVARLRDGHPPVDVIVITAAKDADSVRVAMQGGALHYLLKPFSFPVLRDKLLSYAQMRTRLSALHKPANTGRPAHRGPRVRRAARPRPAGRREGPLGAHPGGGRAAADGDRRGPVRRRGRRAHRHEPRHRPALPQPPARGRPGRHQAPLRQRRPPRARLPLERCSPRGTTPRNA